MRRWSMLLLFLGFEVQVLSQPPAGNSARASFMADANLVLVPVTVMDRRGALVNNLRAETFNVFDDKIPQQICSFTQQDVPASIGVILDMSGSMKATLSQAKFAVRSFLDTANPDDEAFLYSVSSRPKRIADFTEDVDTLLNGVAVSGAAGSTALIDTIYSSLDAMHSADRPRRALLVISDGMDNHSRYSQTELMERALESDVQIYTIAIYNAPAYDKAIRLQEQRRGLTLLQDLADKTGGLSFVVRNAAETGSAAAAISRAIRNEYTIGYAPRNPARDGKWHSIHVKQSLPGLRVYARSGYYAQ